jgi:hypothetical protein
MFRVLRTLSVGLILSAMALPAFSCGPFFDDSCFTFTLHPDLPLKMFASGKLGLVQPTYARSYLVVAYRYLKGEPLSAAEREQALKLWNYRLGAGDGDDSSAKSQKWFELRKKTMAAFADKKKDDKTFDSFDIFRTVNADNYNPYLNCPGDAFDTATKTLLNKVSKYGPDSKQVKDWLKNQDKVFCHCQSPGYDYSKNVQRPEPEFPAPAPADADQESKQDRAYQIAAAHFYAAQYEKALSAFSAIALDSSSPWQKIASYMTARTLIRKATVDAPKDTLADAAGLSAARAKIVALMAEPEMASFKNSLDSLLHFVDLRLSPGECLDRISAKLGNCDEHFGKDLDDYIFLLNIAFKEDPDGNSETHTIADQNLAKIMRAHELSDWLWTFSSKDDASLSHALGRYHEKKDLPWLICVAAKLKGKEPVCPEILSALAKIDKTNSAYLTASYHHARLLEAQNKPANEVIDPALAAGGAPSALNALALLKLSVAPTLDDYLHWAYRSAAGTIAGADGCELSDDWGKLNDKNDYTIPAPLLRPEAAAVLNSRLPLSSFLAAAQSPRIPAGRKFDFAQAAFCRAFLLKDSKSMGQAAVLLKAQLQLKSLLDAYDSAVGDSKDFAAAFMILKNPGFRPLVTASLGRQTQFDKLDDYQDNYWDAKIDDASACAGKFLTPADIAQARAELKALEKNGVASDFLGQIVFAYADKHPTDARVPEALHRLVRATHLSARDNATSAVSKKAHTILHSKYKGNAWTTKTPYYY